MEPQVVLETRNLRKEFDGLVAVDNVSLKVREGQLHAIIGPNGAGKTTLFNLISGVFPPTSGRIFLRGEDITGLPPYQIARKGIGRSFQIINLFPNLTVLESVSLAVQARGPHSLHFWRPYHLYREYEEKAVEIIRKVGLAGREYFLTRVLPHGDQRKLEIALLLAMEPDILLLDEPTAGMASAEVPIIMDLISRLRNEGRHTILLVEHKMDVVMSLSDIITVMHQGRILAEGTPEEIKANEEVQRAYLGEL